MLATGEIIKLWNNILSREGIPALRTPVEIAKQLGSKIGNASGMKQPYLRHKFAQKVSFNDLPDEIEDALFGILTKFYSKRYVINLLAAAKRTNPVVP